MYFIQYFLSKLVENTAREATAPKSKLQFGTGEVAVRRMYGDWNNLSFVIRVTAVVYWKTITNN